MPERTPARRPGEAGPVSTGTAAQPGGAARLPGAVLQSLLLAAVALFFLNFNILGTASPSKRFSQDLVYAWFGNEAWLYPRPTAASAPGMPHARKVVVVMLNEPALALRGARWPVPVQFHAQFLAELEVLKPHSIFLDFLLLDPAPPQDGCALLQVAQRLRAEGVALYLAVTEPQDLALLEVAGCHTLKGAPIRAAEVFTPVAVQRQADNSDFVSRRYPFEQRPPAGAPGSGLPSAAVRMYCDATPAPSQCLARLTAYASADAGFDLAWSPQGDPFNQRWSQEGCAPSISPARAILNEPVLPRESPCPPVATLFADALLSPEVDPALGLDNQTLFDLAQDSFVLVGGNFRGSGDLVTTPLHTLLPGVYYHGVALQNLLAFDGRPKVRKEFRAPKILFYIFDLMVLWVLAAIFMWRQRVLARARPGEHSPFELSAAARAWLAPLIARYPTPAWILGAVLLLLLMATFRSLQLIAVAVVVVLLIVVELRVTPAAERHERLRALWLYLAAMALSLVVIGIAIWLGYAWLRLPPGDWLGYLTFVAFGFFVAHAAILEFGRRVDELHVARHTGEGSQ
jgi:CHASE2 domain-containing sensor protein